MRPALRVISIVAFAIAAVPCLWAAVVYGSQPITFLEFARAGLAPPFLAALWVAVWAAHEIGIVGFLIVGALRLREGRHVASWRWLGLAWLVASGFIVQAFGRHGLTLYPPLSH